MDMITGAGALSNEFGFFSLTLPEGPAVLRISYVGYDIQIVKMNISRDSLLHINLESDLKLPEITVIGEKGETGINSTHSGAW